MCSTDEKPERRCRCVFGLNVWKMYGCIVKYLRYGVLLMFMMPRVNLAAVMPLGFRILPGCLWLINRLFTSFTASECNLLTT